MYIYMSDEEDNIDIKIDVAYKWDVIFSPSLKQTYVASRLLLRRRRFLLLHVSSRLNIILL